MATPESYCTLSPVAAFVPISMVILTSSRIGDRQPDPWRLQCPRRFSGRGMYTVDESSCRLFNNNNNHTKLSLNVRVRARFITNLAAAANLRPTRKVKWGRVANLKPRVGGSTRLNSHRTCRRTAPSVLLSRDTYDCMWS
jgi:hypothetical protein